MPPVACLTLCLHHSATILHTLLEVLDIPRSQCNPDPVDLATLLLKTRLASSWFNRSHLQVTGCGEWLKRAEDLPAAQRTHFSLSQSQHLTTGLCKLRDPGRLSRFETSGLKSGGLGTLRVLWLVSDPTSSVCRIPFAYALWYARDCARDGSQCSSKWAAFPSTRQARPYFSYQDVHDLRARMKMLI